MTKALITVASWEDRFNAGISEALEVDGIDHVCCLASERYLERTGRNRFLAMELCKTSRVSLEMLVFDFYDTVSAFSTINAACKSLKAGGALEIIVDISTAPRNIIWGLLDALSSHYDAVVIRYIRAKEYGDWQTDSDLEPRIIVNCSGIVYPDLPTCLVMMCGPEIARVEKMIYRFEPRRSIVLRDLDAEKYGKMKNLEALSNGSVLECGFDNKDLSAANIGRLTKVIAPLIGDFNIVCSSFGPKLGAILLYKMHKVFEEIALAYVPAGIHNLSLSSGAQAPTNYTLDLTNERGF